MFYTAARDSRRSKNRDAPEWSPWPTIRKKEIHACLSKVSGNVRGCGDTRGCGETWRKWTSVSRARALVMTSKLTEENSAGQQHWAVKKIQNGGDENEKDNILFLESKNTFPATLHVIDISKKNLQVFKKSQKKNLPMFPKSQTPS